MMPSSVLVTATGHDRPGVTAALFAALAAHDVDVIDVEQVVIRSRLILGVLVETRGDPAVLRHGVMTACRAMGIDADVAVDEHRESRRPARVSRHHVILVGHPLRSGAISSVAQVVAAAGGNIDSIVQLGSDPVSSLELLVSGADADELREAMVRVGADAGIDIAIEPAGLRRRAKRLVVLDVDSTLVRGEGIDLLAERAGCGGEVAQITEQAMAGELDFETALRQRVRLLRGLPLAAVHEVRDALVLTPGARTLVRTLRGLGYRIGVVSGGFTVFTDRFAAELKLDFATANELEISGGALTGELTGPIIDRRAKAAALRRFAAQHGVPLEQTVAVGDGANDIDMIEAAGLGIAFNAKAALRESADATVSVPYLDSVLFILGVSRDEFDA
ncbi:MAG: phosphoserine phosphatase SerB [Frankiaceae bacterium]|jgi:phosphoserine phosphatase|nr:phosphoserine phosphatase SerB [Frankiaceae bacterium]